MLVRVEAVPDWVISGSSSSKLEGESVMTAWAGEIVDSIIMRRNIPSAVHSLRQAL